MDTKQPHQLNGAFYGPAIPPPDQPRPHNHRGRSCCCCLFSICWKLVLSIIIVIVLALVIFALIVQPRSFKIYVNEAKLTQFNYSTNNHTLHYNLVLNFTAENPNKKLGIYYDQVEGHAFYEGLRFSSIDVVNWENSFRQYTRSTDKMSGVFSGQQLMLLGQSQLSEFDQDKKEGAFDINVKLYIYFRYRLGDVIASTSKAKANCWIKVPFSGSHDKTMVPAFELTQCDVKF